MADMQASLVKFSTSSMCTALITKHTKTAMYVFTYGLVKIGPAKSSITVWKGFATVIRSIGRSAIICIGGLFSNLLHITQSLITLLVVSLPFSIQKSSRLVLSVSSPPP